MVDGEKCLVVENSLQESNPVAFDYIMAFVRANRLQMNQVCETKISDVEQAPGAKAG